VDTDEPSALVAAPRKEKDNVPSFQAKAAARPETADPEVKRAEGFKRRGPGRPGTDFPETPKATENQRGDPQTEVAIC